MFLSIITINYNNKRGLQKTIDSIKSQTSKHFEHLIIDGGSLDGSVNTIKSYVEIVPYKVLWKSERDKGIYNAMNKGIRLATGEYVQILNSGDTLADIDVVEKMEGMLQRLNNSEEQPIPIIYGNMIKDFGNGYFLKDTCSYQSITPESFLYFYNGTLNHNCAFIRRDLFEKYGYYNEEMKICSDWEWYIKAIILGNEKTYYYNVDVTVFDMFGVSESNGRNKDIIKKERREFLESCILPSVLHDYDIYSIPIFQYLRLKKHNIWPIVVFVERILFKLEKWGILR